MSTTSPAPTSAATQVPQSNSGPQQSPLLFFVALGFGVVFTNLWIIVGVKYCFRYNARNRARQHDENGDPIDLGAMPQNRRRRREKKLMTMDEVNDKFPITKYKSWVSNRAAQGLSTEGGVSQSRAASIKGAEGVIEPIAEVPMSEDTKPKEEVQTTTTEVPTAEASASQPAHAAPEMSTAQEAANTLNQTKIVTLPTTEAAEDEEEAIPPALPGASEMLEAPGDSCAICIDTLEDNDDIRGLTCGHAFHASCLDPWLTSRRACCPLCKADYYIPKPRPENQGNGENGAAPEGNGAEGEAEGTRRDPFETAEIQRPSLAATTPAGGMSRYMPRFSTRFTTRYDRHVHPPRRVASNQSSTAESSQPAQDAGSRFASMFGRTRAPRSNQQSSSIPASDHAEQEGGQTSSSRRWRPTWRRNDTQTAEATTPSQLEAGTTTTTTTTTTAAV